MDADAKREIDALKAQLKAQADGQAALVAAAVAAAIAAAPRQQTDLERAEARELSAVKARVAGVRAKALEVAKAEGETEPKLLKYVIGNVPHYRSGVMYHPGEIIALPNDGEPRHNPSHTWTAYDAKAAKAPSPVEVAEAKAFSQLAKEQAVKPAGPLAPKKAARPSDTEV